MPGIRCPGSAHLVPGTRVPYTLGLVPGSMYKALGLHNKQGHFDESPRCNNCLQGKLVPDYNVTETFKANVGAKTAQNSYGIKVL